jgi:ABC-type uncharacterized transport system involved in gliding motility auxiliary subunit
MQRFVDFLTPIGLAVIVGAMAVSQSAHKLPGKLDYYLIAGAVLIFAHLLLRWQDVVRGVGARQLQHGGNSFIMALTVAGLLGGVNYLVFRHDKSWDLSKSQRFSLADQTKKVVTDLKDEVKFTYFQPSKAVSPATEDRLRSYQALSSKVKYEFVDPLVTPDKTMQYEARGPYPMIFVERGARRERLNADSEEDLTNAIIKVTRDKAKTACFVEGDGERKLEDSGDFGLSQAKSALSRSAYETEKLPLVQKAEIPDTCTLVVVAGPQKDLDPPAIDALRAYVKRGGKVMLMVEPDPKVTFPHVLALLKEWNIDAGNDFVLEFTPIGQIVGVGAGPLTPVIVQYPYHEITKELGNQGLATVFHTARSMKAGTATVEGVTAQNLTETTSNSWGESNFDMSKDPTRDDKDTPGPLSLAAVATVRGPAPAAPAATPGSGEEEPKKDAPEGRVVAIGDVDFASNQLLPVKWNQDFFMNSVSWLAQDSSLISIRPKDPENHRITLSPLQQKVVFGGSLALLPGLFIVGGIASWWFRRG